MRVSYQHANPYHGNESFLLRFHEDGDQTNCVLVDAGDGVDVEELLGDGEYLTAVLLTHAHSDHYQTLAANVRDGASVYTAPGTAAVLDTVLSEGERNHDLGGGEVVSDALEPIEEWEPITGAVAVRPVPAGHAPGAAGFLIKFEDGIDTHHLLATGDFTRRRAGGYPGFQTALPVDIGCMFVTGSTNDSFADALTESVGTAAKRAREGASVLVTADGLTSVQYAYLLGHLGERFDRSVPITLVGHAAKLYADLGYDVPNVEGVPEYDDPRELLAPESVAIAGPDVPTEGSASRLFDVIKDDSNAVLVQVVSGGSTPVASAGCTVYDYELSNHPTEAEVDDVVETLFPMQVVVTHQSQWASRPYKDKYDSFVWTTDGNTDERDIYGDGRWLHPPWLKEWTVRDIRAKHRTTVGPERTDSFPALERATDPDFVAEGLDVDGVSERLHLSADTRPTATDSTMAERESDDTIEPTNPTETAATTEAVADSTSTSAATEPTLSAVLSRLDAIETAVSPKTFSARVVDAGDGVTLLRLPEDVALQHGHEVEVAIRPSSDGGAVDEMDEDVTSDSN